MNQRTNLPFGDAFIVSTPQSDAVGDKLFRQSQVMAQMQMQRDAIRQRALQGMDADMMKEVNNVKTADLPEIYDAYGEYKKTKMPLYFDKNLQNNPKAYAQQQIAANIAQGKLMQLINASKENKDMMLNLRKDFEAHPHMYDEENFGNLYDTGLNTPTSKIGKYGNLQTYLSPPPQTDFPRLISQAQGKVIKIAGKEVPADASGVQMKTPQYEYGSTPMEFYNTLHTSVSSNPQATKEASKVWSMIPQQRIDEVDKAFDEMTPQQWEIATGQPNKPQLPLPQSDAERYVNFKTKEDAVTRRPKEVAAQYRTMQAAKLNLQNDLATKKGIILENLRNGHIRSRAELRHSLGQMDKNDQPLAIDQFLQGMEERAKKGGTGEYTIDGKPHKGYDLENQTALSEQFEKKDGEGHIVQPNMLKLNEDGSITGIFYATKDGVPIRGANGKYVISKSLEPVTLSRDAVLGGMTAKLAPKGIAAKNLVKPTTEKTKPITLSHGSLDNVGK